MTEHDRAADRKVLQGNFKTPPHSIEAEQSVLGGLMLDNQAWERVSELLKQAEDFYHPAHRLIFSALQQLAIRNQPYDALTVSETLKVSNQFENAGGEAYLFELIHNTPSAANIQAYAEIVREKSVLRQLIKASTEIIESAYSPLEQTANELLDTAERKVFHISQTQRIQNSGPVRVDNLLKKAVEHIDRLYHSGSAITGISTGYKDLDDITSGLQPADLIIVAGRPSMGKTILGINIAEYTAIKTQKPVLVFSMEMPGESIAMRMMSSLGRIDQHHMRSGKLEDADWPRIQSSVHMLSETKLFIDDTPALNPIELRSRARRVAREHDGSLGLIVVDYLQLMQSESHRDNRVAEISEISRSLKTLAKELHVPVVALSQLNRGLEQRQDKRPVMSDLRECVIGDTLVCLSDGRRIPIAQLVGQTPEVLAVSETGYIISAASDKVWCVGRKPIFKVRLASGRCIQTTAKHRLLTGDGWKMVGDLQTGTRIALAHHLPEPHVTERWPELRLALLGQLIGDGSYLSGQPMRYTTASEENSQMVLLAATKEFNAKVTRYKGRRTWHQLLISGNGNRWKPKGVNQWLRELGVFGQRSFEKRIPEAVFRLRNEQIAILLRHLWATDGTIYVRKPECKGGHIIHYSTNSVGLAFDVSALLLRLRIVARIQKVQKKDYLPNYMVTITGAQAQLLFLDRVGAFGPRCVQAQALRTALADVISNTNVDTLPQQLFDRVRLLMGEQGITHRKMANMRGTSYGGSGHFSFSPSREVLREYAELLKDDVLSNHCENDLYWDRVVLIEEAGEADVYDLTVPGPASWLADGIVSHNSGAIEQDADVIMFIYRDEVYNPNTQDKGIAEIIISKQRNGPIGKIKLTFLGKYVKFENYLPESFGQQYSA